MTLEQLLALYTDPESHNAQRHRQTDGRTTAYANSRSYCVAVRSAKKRKKKTSPQPSTESLFLRTERQENANHYYEAIIVLIRVCAVPFKKDT